MAEYLEDFSDEAVNSLPSKWTRRWVQTGTSLTVRETAEGRYLEVSRNGNHRCAVTYDPINADPDRADIHTRILFRALTTGFDCRALSRVAGTDGNSATGYAMGSRHTGNADQIEISRYNNGNFSALAQAGFSVVRDAWYWLETESKGNEQRMKVWGMDEPVPSEWTLESVNSNVTAAGPVGFFSFNAGTFHIKEIAFGTGADSAPIGLLATIPKLTGLRASNITATSITPTVEFEF